MLLKLERSRLLLAWWIGLHLLIGLSVWLIHPLLALGAGPMLLAHAVRRNPVRSGLLIVSRGARFGLPGEARFDLGLAPASTIGPLWAELVFADRPASRLLVLRDQLDAAGWRRLQLALRKSE